MEMTKRLGAERLNLAAATCFRVLALAGTVAGRDIALLLVPTAIVPLLLMSRTFTYNGAGKWNPSCAVLAVYDIFHAGSATSVAWRTSAAAEDSGE